MKARATGQKRDKTLAKKARQKVQRVTEKVSVRRTAAREAKANVAKLKAQDLLDARMNNIDVRLRRAEEAATMRIEAKLDRQTEKFRATTLEKLGQGGSPEEKEARPQGGVGSRRIAAQIRGDSAGGRRRLGSQGKKETTPTEGAVDLGVCPGGPDCGASSNSRTGPAPQPGGPHPPTTAARRPNRPREDRPCSHR